MSVASDSPSKADSDDTIDKPFICPSLGCNQKFVSADRLAVHKQKHQMTLTLGPSKLTSLADVLPVDQTPTPTRFLHLGNQIGLFDELNPFDREFKTAQKDGISTKQRRAAAVVQQLQALSNKNKSPSTPTRATTTNSLDGNAYSISGQPVHVITITPTLPSPVAGLPGATGQFFVPPLLPSPQGLIPALPGYTATSPMQVPANLLSPTLMPFPSGFIPGMPASLMADAHQRAFTQAMFAAAASSSLATNSSISMSNQNVENPSIDHRISTNTNANNMNLHRTGSLPIPSMILPKQERPMSVSSVTSDTSNRFPEMPEVCSIITQSETNSLPPEPYQTTTSTSGDMMSYPAVVQLPNGQTTCLDSTSTDVNNVSTLAHNASDDLPSVSTIKMKHPIVNTQSSSNHHALVKQTSNELESNPNLLDAKQKLKETLTSNNPNLQHQLISNQSSMELWQGNEAKTNSSGRRRGRQSQEVDPDIKRQRFLERNRAAASRCRSKKKVWVNGLESKAKGLSQTNIMLQNEIAALKDEIASLKQLLLSHRDCPITKMQQQNMVLAGISLDAPSTISSSSVKSESAEDSLHPALTNTLSGESLEDSPQLQNAMTNKLSNNSMFSNINPSTSSTT